MLCNITYIVIPILLVGEGHVIDTKLEPEATTWLSLVASKPSLSASITLV